MSSEPIIAIARFARQTVYLTQLNKTALLTATSREDAAYAWVELPDGRYTWQLCSENFERLAPERIPVLFAQTATLNGVGGDLGKPCILPSPALTRAFC